MATVICPKCKGLKRILGLGMLERDCDKCGAKGRVAAETSADSQSSTSDNKLRDDLRSLSDAYTDAQTENEKIKDQIAALTAKKDNADKKLKGAAKNK